MFPEKLDSTKEQQLDYKHNQLLSEDIDRKYLLAILLGVTYFLSLIPWNNLLDGDLYLIYILYLLLTLLAVQYYMLPYLTVTEQGRLVWIFNKYRFAPTSAKRLCHAKLLLLARFCKRQLIVNIILQLSSSILFYHTIDLANLLPLVSIVILFLLKSLQIIYHASKRTM